jgi:quaternary ammonium compound-resistance protein SugE
LLRIAGVVELGWPLGLKPDWAAGVRHPGWMGFSGACVLISGALLLYAQATIPIGTAYAVWTGIDAVGVFFIGIVVFHEAASTARFFVLGLIGSGVVGLKITSWAIGAKIFRKRTLSCLCGRRHPRYRGAGERFRS